MCTDTSNKYDTTVTFETVEEITNFLGLENLLSLKTPNDIKDLNKALQKLEGGGKTSKKKKTTRKGNKSKNKKTKKRRRRR